MPTLSKNTNRKSNARTKKLRQKNSMSCTAIMGLLHLVGGVLGTWGRLAVLIFYLIKKEEFSSEDMEVFYNIMNFNLSFFLYMIIAFVLIVILVGIPLLVAIPIIYLIILIIASIYHLQDKPYEIPLSIQFFK